MKIGDKITDGSASFIVRKMGGGGQLIKGIIMAFSGTFDSNGYPIDPDTNAGDTGWHICDGTNGTPDLRGRFILGASDSHTVGSTGGEENHTLTIDEMPSHTHVFERMPKFYNETNYNDDEQANMREEARRASNVERANTYSTGGDQPHNNMPPYYALSYIMKI